jgi:O-antigen/teichoic acid export membrane protein
MIDAGKMAGGPPSARQRPRLLPRQRCGARRATRRTARATLLVIGFVLISRVLGVVRDIVIARLFGQNTVTDVYTQAFRVPDMMYLLMAGGALSAVFVPVFTEYLSGGRETDAWKAFSTTIRLVAIGAAVLVVVLEALAPWVMRLIAPRVSDATLAEIVPLTRILLPAQWCFFVGGLMMGTLQARDRFFIPSLGPVCTTALLSAARSSGGPCFIAPRPTYPRWRGARSLGRCRQLSAAGLGSAPLRGTVDARH